MLVSVFATMGLLWLNAPTPKLTATVTKRMQLASDTAPVNAYDHTDFSGDSLILPERQGPGIQTTALYTDIIAPDGRIVPVPSPVEQLVPMVSTSGLGPTTASVTLTLQDRSGNAATTACVHAFSEDSQVILPRLWQRACADATGITIMHLPLGRWSFFGSGATYFTSVLSQTINDDTSTIIRPSSSITLEVKNFAGAPLNSVDVYLVETHRRALVPPAHVGSTSSGTLVVSVSPELNYDVLLVRYPSPGVTGTAFFVHAGSVSAGSTLNYQMHSDQLALLRFNLTNGQGTPGPRSSLGIKYPDFTLDFEVWFSRDSGWWWSKLEVWLSPEPVITKVVESADNWHFDFGPYALELQTGTSRDFTVGGVMDVRMWFYPLLDNGRQVWVQARDSNGHTLFYFYRSDGRSDIPIKLRDSGGNLVYSGTIRTDSLTGLLPVDPHGLNYETNVDLGFFGIYTLTGQALDADSTWPLEPITTSHFLIYWPTQLNTQVQTVTLMAEQSYSETVATLGHTTQSWHSHGKIEVHFPFYCECAGWAGGSTFAVKLDSALHGDAMFLGEIDGFKGVWAHELLHVFQGIGTGLSGYYVTGWFGEPFATFNGDLSMGRVIDENQGRYMIAKDLVEGFYSKVGSEMPPDWGKTYYVLEEVSERYTMQAHRDWIQFWAGSNRPNRSCLSGLGMTDVEEIATGYSHVTHENLSWLFREAYFDVSDARIQQGIDAIAACTPLSGVAISGPTSGTVGNTYAFTATISPITATGLITYAWSPSPSSGQGTAVANYRWLTAGVKTIAVAATRANVTVTDTHSITIVYLYTVYLPIVLHDSP